jgi:hypothetical protein
LFVYVLLLQYSTSRDDSVSRIGSTIAGMLSTARKLAKSDYSRNAPKAAGEVTAAFITLSIAGC